MNWLIVLSQFLTAIQTFVMMLLINLRFTNPSEFSFYSGLITLIPVTLVLCRLFLVDPVFIIKSDSNRGELLTRNRLTSLALIAAVSSMLVAIWSALFGIPLEQMIVTILVFYCSSIGEGVKFYIFNFKKTRKLTYLNTICIFLSILSQVFICKSYEAIILAFFCQSIFFQIIFCFKFFRTKSSAVLSPVKFKEILIQGFEGVLAFLEVFILMIFFRLMTQNEELINFQQSLILVTPLNSLINFVSLGVYGRLFGSGEDLNLKKVKRFLIAVILFYMNFILLLPFDLTEFVFKNVTVNEVKLWFIAQCISLVMSILLIDKYYGLKKNEDGYKILLGRLIELFLICSTIFVFYSLGLRHFIYLAFLFGMTLSCLCWYFIHRKYSQNLD